MSISSGDPSVVGVDTAAFAVARATLVVKAWEDPEFLASVVERPREALAEAGCVVPDGVEVGVLVDSSAGINVVLGRDAAVEGALDAVRFGLEHGVPVRFVREDDSHMWVRIPPTPPEVNDEIIASYNLVNAPTDQAVDWFWHSSYALVSQFVTIMAAGPSSAIQVI